MEALFRTLFEAVTDDALEGRRDAAGSSRQLWRIGRQDGVHRLGR